MTVFFLFCGPWINLSCNVDSAWLFFLSLFCFLFCFFLVNEWTFRAILTAHDLFWSMNELSCNLDCTWLFFVDQWISGNLRESQRSLCSGWYCLLLPPHYTLVDAVSFYLHIRTIFSENLRDHYALVDVVSFYLRILFWLMLSPSTSTYDQFSQIISEIIVFCFMLSPSCLPCIFSTGTFSLIISEKQRLSYCFFCLFKKSIFLSLFFKEKQIFYFC